MPRILVALDDSCGSEKALEAAVNLAQQDGGRVTAVAVLEHIGNPRLDRLTEDLRSRRGVAWRNSFRLRPISPVRGVRLTPVLREGHPANAIIMCAEEEQANLSGPRRQQRAQGQTPAWATPRIR